MEDDSKTLSATPTPTEPFVPTVTTPLTWTEFWELHDRIKACEKLAKAAGMEGTLFQLLRLCNHYLRLRQSSETRAMYAQTAPVK